MFIHFVISLEESLADTMADEDSNSSPDLPGKLLEESEEPMGDLSKVNISAASCALTVASIETSNSGDLINENVDNEVDNDEIDKELSYHSIESNSTITIDLPVESDNLCNLFGIRNQGVFAGGLHHKVYNDLSITVSHYLRVFVQEVWKRFLPKESFLLA